MRARRTPPSFHAVRPGRRCFAPSRDHCAATTDGSSVTVTPPLTARGESLAAFDGRCIPAPPQRGCRVGDPAGCVAPRSNTPGILGRRALPSGRLARLGATPDFHHGLLTAEIAEKGSLCDLRVLRG